MIVVYLLEEDLLLLPYTTSVIPNYFLNTYLFGHS